MRTVALPGGETVSALGQGTWYMGEKYAEKWAAMAASAAATRPAGFPFDRLKGMPIISALAFPLFHPRIYAVAVLVLLPVSKSLP